MGYFFILNPASRGGKSRKIFARLFRVLREKGIKYEARITSNIEEARTLSVEANLQGYKTVVAVGGDGTINRVLNGFYDEAGNRNSSASFGVIHTGTSPDFCKSYGIPTAFDRTVSALLRGRTRPVRIGKVRYAAHHLPAYAGKPCDDSGHFTTGYFACCANIGIGASVARLANSGIRAYAGDFAGTFLSLLWALALYRPCDFTVVRDGMKKKVSRLHSLSVGKTRFIASGLKVRHELREDDLRLYQLTVNRLRLRQLPAVLQTLYLGKAIINGKGPCSLNYGNTLEIWGNRRPAEIEFDGDPAGYLPCKIEAAPGPLDVIVERVP